MGIPTFEVIQTNFTSREEQEPEDCGHTDYRSWRVFLLKIVVQGNIFNWILEKKEENGQIYQ